MQSINEMDKNYHDKTTTSARTGFDSQQLKTTTAWVSRLAKKVIMSDISALSKQAPDSQQNFDKLSIPWLYPW